MSAAIPYSKEQLDAINHKNGNLQIIACAGSGKTEAVSMKIANLVKNGIDPESIVAFTFTEKAAAELGSRIRDAVRRTSSGIMTLGNMYVGTIHGFCFKLLKEFVPKYQNFDPLEERTRVSFLAQKMIYEELKLDGLGVNGKYNSINEFCKNIDALREEEITSEDLQDSPLRESMSRYESMIEEKKVLDFTSMLYLTLKVLGDKSVLKKVREKYRYVIVDEYQDVNRIQEKIISLICGKDGNLTVVGDDDQSIYQWRGADVDNMIHFEERYNKVKPVKLEHNYRSTEHIISNANMLIKKNRKRLPKEMKKGNKNNAAEKGDCYLIHFDTREEEADWIVAKIRSLVGTEFKDKDGTIRPLTLGDFAVLVRSVGKPSEVLIPRMRANGIEYYIKGTAGLFSRPEIHLVMECLSFVSGFEYADGAGVPSVKDLEEQYLGAFPAKEHLVREFAKRIKRVRKGSWDDGQFHPSVLQMVYQSILNAIGLEDEEFSELQMHQLGKFSTVITDFERYNSMTKMEYLRYFFGFVRGYAEGSYEEGGQDEDLFEDAVLISTIHGVKGLEFPVVFMPYLIDKFFPTAMLGRHRKWLFDQTLLADPSRYDSNEADERRLFYVGMTRSKKYLFLTWATQVHTARAGTQSRFLSEIDRSVMISENVADPTKRKKSSAKTKPKLKLFPTSYSELRYYMACPYDYKMRHVYQFNPVMVTALGYGQQVHNCLNLIHRTFKESGKMDVKTAQKIVDEHFFLRYAGGKVLKNLKKGVEKAAVSYVKKYGGELDHVLESEKPFEFGIDEIIISGTIDLIKKADEEKPEVIEVIDFKNEKQKVKGEVPEDTKMQLRLYAVACKESLGYNPKRAMVHNLDDNSRTVIDLKDDVMDSAKGRVREIVDDIRIKEFPMSPGIGRKCENCDWNTICTKNYENN